MHASKALLLRNEEGRKEEGEETYPNEGEGVQIFRLCFLHVEVDF